MTAEEFVNTLRDIEAQFPTGTPTEELCKAILELPDQNGVAFTLYKFALFIEAVQGWHKVYLANAKPA